MIDYMTDPSTESCGSNSDDFSNDVSSTSSSPTSSFGVRTGDSRAADGCTTAALEGQNLTLRATDYENAAVRHGKSTQSTHMHH